MVGLETLLGSLRAFAIPMTAKFRGITVREGALIEGRPGGGSSPRSPSTARASRPAGWPARWGPGNRMARRGPRPGSGQRDGAGRGSRPGLSDRRVIGCRTAKVKVAERDQTDADDIARVEAVPDTLGPDGRVRIDVNGRWDVAHATRMLAALAPFGLEYAEQPCMTLAEMAELRRATDVPLAADESIRKAEDPMRVRAAGAANVVVLKVQPLAGVHAALRVAKACGLPVVVSSAVDTSIGLAAGLALAGALPDLPYACGLGTMSLLAGTSPQTPWTRWRENCRCGALPSTRASCRGGRWTRRPGAAGPRPRRSSWARRREPVDGAGRDPGRRADPLRDDRGGARARFPERAAGDGVVHPGAARGSAAARPHRRALGGVPGARPGQGERPRRRAWSARPGRRRPASTLR